MTQLLSLFSAWARGCSSFLATTLAGASQVDHAEHQPAQASRTSSGKPLLWVAAEFGSDVHAVVILLSLLLLKAFVQLSVLGKPSYVV